MGQKVRLMVIRETDEHEVPAGWCVHSAFPLRTSGANASVGLLLVEEVPVEELAPPEGEKEQESLRDLISRARDVIGHRGEDEEAP